MSFSITPDKKDLTVSKRYRSTLLVLDRGNDVRNNEPKNDRQPLDHWAEQTRLVSHEVTVG